MGTPVDLTSSREDDDVEAQSSREHCDPAKGGHDILAASQHQTAVDDDAEQFLVGPHGNLPVICLLSNPRSSRALSPIMLLTPP
jgi:hypothetical protein